MRVLTRSPGAGKHIKVWETICKTHRLWEGKKQRVGWPGGQKVMSTGDRSGSHRNERVDDRHRWQRCRVLRGGHRKVKEPGLPGDRSGQKVEEGYHW